jgi:L-ascorbate metabolism protein UlaG (beta-lactamase superfamily)
MRSLGSKPDGLRLERMRASALWHRGAFRNVRPILPRLLDSPVPMPTVSEFLFGGDRRVPKAPLPALDPRDAWAKKPRTGLRTTWLGHSTVLLEMDGVRVLTDPVWGARASPWQWAGPKRFQPVPVPVKALPPLDAVIISHDHYDHLDYTTIRALARRDVPFITSLGVGAHLEAWGVPAARIVELDWWESYSHPKLDLTVTAGPSQHFSGRGLRTRNSTLWSSLVVRSRRHAVFFSGDTGLTTEYAAILERLGPFDLVMLEVGAFHPAWGHIHLGPENALEAWALLGKSAFLPVHWGTFSLAMHAWDEPAETLYAHGARLGVPLLMPHLGEPVEPSRVERVQPWWRAVERLAPDEPPAKREPPAAPTTLPWPMD